MNHDVELVATHTAWIWQCSCGARSRRKVARRKVARDAAYQHRLTARRQAAVQPVARSASAAAQIRAVAR